VWKRYRTGHLGLLDGFVSDHTKYLGRNEQKRAISGLEWRCRADGFESQVSLNYGVHKRDK